MNSAFCRCAVVASDVDDKRVVSNTKCVQRLDDARNLRISVCKKSGKRLHESSRHWLISVGVVGPCWYLFRTLGECGVSWNYAKFKLAFIDHFAQRIPAIVKLSLEFVDPFARHMMWRVHGRSGEVAKERTVVRRCVLTLHPCDCLIGQIFGEVVTRLANMRSDWCCLVIHGWLPL